jgi:acetylornithine deacetylase
VGRVDAELAEEIGRAIEVRRGDAVRLLQDLVRVPSVTGEEGAVQEVVERAFRERGLAVDAWEATPEEVAPYLDHVGEQSAYEGRPNIVGVRTGRGGGRSILLNAHVDTLRAGTLRPGAATRSPGRSRGTSSRPSRVSSPTGAGKPVS